eukprot:Selendium_serpulae@DN6501_c2_g1_i7.p1
MAVNALWRGAVQWVEPSVVDTSWVEGVSRVPGFTRAASVSKAPQMREAVAAGHTAHCRPWKGYAPSTTGDVKSSGKQQSLLAFKHRKSRGCNCGHEREQWSASGVSCLGAEK